LHLKCKGHDARPCLRCRKRDHGCLSRGACRGMMARQDRQPESTRSHRASLGSPAKGGYTGTKGSKCGSAEHLHGVCGKGGKRRRSARWSRRFVGSARLPVCRTVSRRSRRRVATAAGPGSGVRDSHGRGSGVGGQRSERQVRDGRSLVAGISVGRRAARRSRAHARWRRRPIPGFLPRCAVRRLGAVSTRRRPGLPQRTARATRKRHSNLNETALFPARRCPYEATGARRSHAASRPHGAANRWPPSFPQTGVTRPSLPTSCEAARVKPADSHTGAKPHRAKGSTPPVRPPGQPSRYTCAGAREQVRFCGAPERQQARRPADLDRPTATTVTIALVPPDPPRRGGCFGDNGAAGPEIVRRDTGRSLPPTRDAALRRRTRSPEAEGIGPPERPALPATWTAHAEWA
jgi:hypothetical protein